MKRVGSKYVRIMSYKPGDDEYQTPPEVFKRVKEVTQENRQRLGPSERNVVTAKRAVRKGATIVVLTLRVRLLSSRGA